MSVQPKILMLPEWFPNEENLQLGIFIQKHIELIAVNNSTTVLFVQSVKNLPEKYLIEQKKEKGYWLVHAKYRSAKFSFLNSIRYSQAVKRAVKNIDRPDLIHLHVTGKNYLIRKLFFSKIPFVITEHWSGFGKGKTLIGEHYTKEAFKNANAISVVSDYLGQQLKDNFNVSTYQIIPNRIEKCDPAVKSNDEIKMLFVGDLVDELKNISGILKAVQAITFTQTTTLTIVGDGDDRDKLKEIAKKINQKNLNIHFVGRKTNEETLNYMAQSDFLIMNSRSETFSMVCAEALLAGIPVIATRCGGPESYLNSENSILIGVDQHEELVSAIKNMLVNYKNYNFLQLINSVAERFSDESIRQSFLNLYQKALNN